MRRCWSDKTPVTVAICCFKSGTGTCKTSRTMVKPNMHSYMKNSDMQVTTSKHVHTGYTILRYESIMAKKLLTGC